MFSISAPKIAQCINGHCHHPKVKTDRTDVCGLSPVLGSTASKPAGKPLPNASSRTSIVRTSSTGRAAVISTKLVNRPGGQSAVAG